MKGDYWKFMGTYRLVIQQANVFEGSLCNLIKHLHKVVLPGESVEIYRRSRTMWYLEDGMVWKG